MVTHSAPTHVIDKYITELTRPLLSRIPGSLLDTLDLLGRLPTEQLTAGTRVVTADVNSLYPSIPWDTGMDAAVDFYRDNLAWLGDLHRERGWLEPPTAGIFRELLGLVLQNSYIHFQGGRWFRQMKGTAMGCCISVYFANTYMLSVTRQVVEAPPPHILLFVRFINDILVLTTGSEEEIQTLFGSISNEHISYEISRARASGPLIDLQIYIRKLRVETKTYAKPTSVPFFLHANSNHPKHLIRSIPYAQLLHLKRNSSRESDYRKGPKALLQNFRTRGYPGATQNTSCSEQRRNARDSRGKCC